MLELGSLGIALARTVDNSLSHEVLRPEQAHEIRERLERFGSFRGLFDHLQDCTRRSAEKIPMYRMVTDHTLEYVRKQFDITRERIRQTEAKASGELRHPARRGSK